MAVESAVRLTSLTQSVEYCVPFLSSRVRTTNGTALTPFSVLIFGQKW
jgi:hypothetical protein